MRRTLLPALVVALLATGCSGSPAPGPSSATPAAPTDPATTAAPATAATPATSGAVQPRGPQVQLGRQGDRTVVRVLDRAGTRQLGNATLPGRWQLPAVVPGTPSDGVTAAGAVVLVGPSDAGRSRFAVLTAPYRTPAMVELPGRFGYDAVSPDGRRLYLVESLPPAGSEHYRVRSYDVPGRGLDPTVVADKTHLDEWMAGHPVARAMSADGATVATLYQRRGGEPFIHVLNTVEGFALCLDLPAEALSRPLTLSLPGDGTLVVTDPSGVPRYQADLTSGRLDDLAAVCRTGMSSSALPSWALTGFSGDGSGVPHVLADQGRILAVLFGYPMKASADPGVSNKILWVEAPAPPGASPGGGQVGLTLEGRLLGSTTRITRELPQGPGPSGVNFPRAGCWSVSLRWSGRTDTLLLPVE